MPDYELLYHIMFNAATDCLRHLEQGRITDGMLVLAAAQCQCEELYICENAPDTE